MTQADRQCSFCTVGSFEAKDRKSHRAPVCKIGCLPGTRPIPAPVARSGSMNPFLLIFVFDGNVQTLQHFFFAFRLTRVTQFELPQAFACDPWLCRLSALENSGHLISWRCALVVDRLLMTLMECYSRGHSQGWDFDDVAQMLSDQDLFGKHAPMEMSFRSLHPFHSSRLDCMANNWRGWDWLSLSVLHSRLDGAVLPPMEAWAQEQLA